MHASPPKGTHIETHPKQLNFSRSQFQDSLQGQTDRQTDRQSTTRYYDILHYTTLPGGSWVVISGVISPLIRVINIATLLIAPLITTHEPPSTLHSPQKLQTGAMFRVPLT